jgi:predicted PurR-regulated permease PerM
VWLVLLLGTTFLAGLVLIAHAGLVLLVLFAGVLLALFLSGTAAWLAARLPLPYWILLALVVAAIIAIIGFAGYLVGPHLMSQVAALIDKTPAVLGPLIGGRHVGEWLHRLAKAEGEGLTHDIAVLISAASGAISWTLELIVGIVVFCFIGLYGAAQPDVYRRAMLRLVPVHARPRAEEVTTTIVHALRRWLFGRVVAMIFVGVGTTVAFWALGVPLPLALGLLAGLLAFIEYIGAILSALPAIALAFEKGLATAVWVTVLFTGVHLVEGYLLSPMIARRTVRFPPAFTLALQVIFGLFFGILGVTLATPVSVILVLLVRMLYVEDTLGDHGSPPAASMRPG